MIDLSHIEAYRENNRLEAKRAQGGFPQSLWETYSAFANTIGGLILLGVEEDADGSFRVVGVPDIRSHRRAFWQHLNNPHRVSANIMQSGQVRSVRLQGKDVLLIEVPRARRQERPIYIEGNPYTGSYRRDGEGDYHCSAEEVRSMLRDRDDTPADLAPLSCHDLTALSAASLRAFRLLMALRRPTHPWLTLPDEPFLLVAGAAVEGSRGQRHPSVAGLLLLGQYPALRSLVPGFRTEYREELPGGLRFRAGAADFSGNLFDFYSRVSERLQALSRSIRTEEGEGEALFSGMQEAAVNAILHADYFGGAGLSILRTAEALQFSNGGLPRVDPAQAHLGAQAQQRNRGLVRLFSLIRVGSGRGRGLRDIYDTWAKEGLSRPKLEEVFGPDSTRLHLPLRGFTREKEAVIALLTRHISADAAQIAAQLSLPLSQVRSSLAELLEEKLLLCEAGMYRLRD